MGVGWPGWEWDGGGGWGAPLCSTGSGCFPRTEVPGEGPLLLLLRASLQPRLAFLPPREPAAYQPPASHPPQPCGAPPSTSSGRPAPSRDVLNAPARSLWSLPSSFVISGCCVSSTDSHRLPPAWSGLFRLSPASPIPTSKYPTPKHRAVWLGSRTQREGGWRYMATRGVCPRPPAWRLWEPVP